jgi:hypothetical protein
MPANQKTVRAAVWLTHGGKLFSPGSVLDPEKIPQYAIDSALAHGEAVEDAGVAEEAAKQETERQEKVAEAQASRSEKRGKSADDD